MAASLHTIASPLSATAGPITLAKYICTQYNRKTHWKYSSAFFFSFVRAARKILCSCVLRLYCLLVCNAKLPKKTRKCRKRIHIAVQNDTYCDVKRYILRRKTIHIGAQKDTYCIAKGYQLHRRRAKKRAPTRFSCRADALKCDFLL